MSHPITSTVTIIAGNATLIGALQTLTSPNLYIEPLGPPTNGTGITLDAPRRISIFSTGNDTGITWTVTGTARPEQGGIAISETIAGGSGAAVYTTQDFATVTSILASGTTASTVTAGTNGVASGPWVVWDSFVEFFMVAAQGQVLSGSPTWQIDVTDDDPFLTWLPSSVPFPRAQTSFISGQTGSYSGNLSGSVRASRLTLTAYGSVQLSQQQSGN